MLKPSFLIAILFCCHVSKAQDSTNVKKEPTTRQLQPLIIDGKENDWPAILPYIDKDAGISYSITHDDSEVYICLKAKDDVTSAKILRAGLTVSIDGTGKKKQTSSLLFPLAVDDEFFPGSSFDLKAMEAVAYVQAKQYRLTGFTNGNGTFTSGQKNDAGVKVSTGFNDKGELLYEAAIPFAAFYTKEKITGEDNGKTIAVVFSINALTKPLAADNNSRSSSVNLNSQFYTSRTPAGMRQMQQLYVKTKTWKLITLDAVNH